MRMTRLLLIAASFLAATILVPKTAAAQQYATNTTCFVGLDGGGPSTISASCPAVLLNYSPFTVTCETTTATHTSAVGTTTFALSPDGVNFGADGGVQLPISVAASTTLGSTASLSPTNPYLYGQIQVNSTQDGGSSASFETCTVSVIQSQTIHLAKPKNKLAVGVPKN